MKISYKYNSITKNIKKININEKNDLINKHNFKYNDTYKKYTINNVEILFNIINYNFYKITNKNKIIKNDYIIYDFDETKIELFNFYKTHKEEIYKEYISKKNNYIIKLKEYDNYLTIEIIFENNFNLNNFNLFDI
tara:strand:- start:412 stop:819 length:408 start_codon:yes stop_codon:yes gene_type:complete